MFVVLRHRTAAVPADALAVQVPANIGKLMAEFVDGMVLTNPTAVPVQFRVRARHVDAVAPFLA